MDYVNEWIVKFSTLKGQISALLWTHIGHKGWRKNGKTFIRCYTFTLKFWDEFNANFVLLYFSSYSSIKMWHLYLKDVEKNTYLKPFQYEETSCLGTQKELSIYFSVYSKLRMWMEILKTPLPLIRVGGCWPFSFTIVKVAWY